MYFERHTAQDSAQTWKRLGIGRSVTNTWISSLQGPQDPSLFLGQLNLLLLNVIIVGSETAK